VEPAFPTGVKLSFAAAAEGDRRFVVCMPTKRTGHVQGPRDPDGDGPTSSLKAMTIAGYAIGATEGILTCAAEYTYLCKG